MIAVLNKVFILPTSSLKNIFKGTAIYSVSSLFRKASAILMVPIFARLLSPHEYGISGLLTPIIEFIPLFFTFGLYVSQMREYGDLSGNKEKLGSYFFSINVFIWIVSLTFVFLAISPIGIAFFHLFIDFNEVAFYPFIFVAILIGFIKIFNLIATNYFQTIQNYTRIGITSVFSSIISISLALFLIIYFDLGVLGKILGILIASMFSFAALYLSYAKQFKLDFNRKMLTSSLALGFPIQFSTIMSIIINFSDRLILVKYVSLAEIGIYTIAYTAGMVIIVFITSFIDTWKPIFFDKLRTNDKSAKDVLVYFIFGLFGISLVGQLLSKEIVYILFPVKYFTAADYIPYILPSIALMGIYQFIVPYFHFYKQTKFVPYITFVSATLNIGINIIFIPEYGVMAAIWSTFISFFVTAFIMFLLVYKKFNIVFPYFKILSIILMAFNPVLFYLCMSEISINSAILKIIYLCLYIAISLYFILDYKKLYKFLTTIKLRRK